jgi:hypothetical protein
VVGDVSPKHHVGASRLAFVRGWQFVLQTVWVSDFCPNTESKSASADRPTVGENLSAKGRLPLDFLA